MMLYTPRLLSEVDETLIRSALESAVGAEQNPNIQVERLNLASKIFGKG
jgi:hypothetical protein